MEPGKRISVREVSSFCLRTESESKLIEHLEDFLWLLTEVCWISSTSLLSWSPFNFFLHFQHLGWTCIHQEHTWTEDVHDLQTENKSTLSIASCSWLQRSGMKAQSLSKCWLLENMTNHPNFQSIDQTFKQTVHLGLKLIGNICQCSWGGPMSKGHDSLQSRCLKAIGCVLMKIKLCLALLLCRLIYIPGRNGVKGKTALSDRTQTMFATEYPFENSLSSASKGYAYFEGFP